MTAPVPAKRMRLRYAGTCRSCSVALPAGEWAVYLRDLKQVECVACFQSAASFGDDGTPAPETEAEAVTASQAGASARREYERRVAKREQRIRSAHPRLGGLILALFEEPQSTRAWSRGAAGEEKLARRLDPLTERGARLLHDRRIPGTRANIDHLLVAPAGIFVIDAKRYAGRPQLRAEGGILRPRTETLLVGRRDCTKLLAGLHKQLELVHAAVQRDALPVHGMLCFVDADWPSIGGNFTIDGIEVLWPKKVADRVFDPSRLTEAQIAATYDRLATAFPPA